MPSRYEREKAVPHIVYEYANLVSAGTLLGEALPASVNTHVQDAFLLNCRKLADFFLKEPSGDDVGARHYLTVPLPTFALPTWRKWKTALNKQLAHITYARVNHSKPWDGTPNKPLLDEFRRAWKQFLLKMDHSYTKAFDTAITKRLNGRGFERLDLR